MNPFTPQAGDYLPVEVIFNLLCVCRRQTAISLREVRQAVQQRGLAFGDERRLPSLPFWLRLCQAASLLDEQPLPSPTLFAEDWLGYSWGQQIATLLDAWLEVPQLEKNSRARRQLLTDLTGGHPLSKYQQTWTSGLEALGLYAGNQLTEWGAALLRGELQESSPQPPLAWQIVDEELHIPYPPDWLLLWRLEAYLNPSAPGVYPLDAARLRAANQQPGERNTLTEILAQGLDAPLPEALEQAIASQPVVRVLPGPVLEFSDPQELADLRCTRAWRRELEHLLAPRYVHLDPFHAPAVLRRLEQRGLLAAKDLQPALGEFAPNPAEPGAERPEFSRADRAYLLSLLLLAEGLRAPFAPPPGLFSHLVTGLDDRLRAAAARKASQALAQLAPVPSWVPEEEPPSLPEDDLVDFLQKAIAIEQPVDITYQASQQSTPEYRHVTPLLLEQRGPRYYLLAYCHNRRSNRTFRLDRLRLVDFPPLA